MVQLVKRNFWSSRSHCGHASLRVNRKRAEDGVDMRLGLAAFGSPWQMFLHDVETLVARPDIYTHPIVQAEQHKDIMATESVGLS